MIPRLRKILTTAADYYTLTRAQIQCVTGDTNDRVMRKHLLQLVQQGFLNKTRMHVVNPGDGAPAPVYFPSRKGAEFLAAEVDEKYLHACTQNPNWMNLHHWTTVAQFHVVLDMAIALQDEATIGGWLGEWDVANPDEKAPEKRFRLFTLLKEKPNRLVCNPDAAFFLRVKTFAKVYYLEVDRETSGIQQIAASKTPGFAELAKVKGHLKHFAANVGSFSVLSISPTPGRRDLLRKAINGKDGCDLWKFCCWPDFTVEKALFAPIWYPCNGDSAPLVRRSAETQPRESVESGVPSVNGSGMGPPRTAGRI